MWKWFLVVGLLAAPGCGKGSNGAENSAKFDQAMGALRESVTAAGDVAESMELKSLAMSAQELLDGIFANEWSPVAGDPEMTASTSALMQELFEIDEKTAKQKAKVAAIRSRNSDIDAEHRHEANVWRQRRAELAARAAAAEKLVAEVESASQRVIREQNASGVNADLIGRANAEVADELKLHQKNVAELKLEAEKARRMLAIYE